MDIPSHDENGFDGSHAKVVVVLLRKLLAAQFIHLSHLPRQSLTGLEALRVQDHLQRTAKERERERILSLKKKEPGLFYFTNKCENGSVLQ